VTAPNDRCGEMGELLAVYALDALDETEAEMVRSHAESCPRCAHELDAHRETIGLLASVGGEAPAGVWTRIAAAIEPATTSPRQPAPLVLPVGSRARRRRLAVRGLAVAAVVAAAVMIGIQTVRVDHLNHRVTELGAATEQVGGLPGVAAALVDPTAAHLRLASTSPGATPLGQFVILPSGAAYLVGGSLPALTGGRIYQLWSVVSGRAVSVGLLGSHPVTAAFTTDPHAAVSEYLVTVEPSGGVVAPTTSPVARATA
jgi:hypothetical protein